MRERAKTTNFGHHFLTKVENVSMSRVTDKN